MENDKLAEEILNKWKAIDESLPHWITVRHALKAMRDYAEAYHEAKLKEELIAFAIRWNRSKYITMIKEEDITEYLKQRNNGTI
jgi:hypothetical protein